MEILKNIFKENPECLWKNAVHGHFQTQVTNSSTYSNVKPGEIDNTIVYMEDLEKRKEVYGICGECYEPGTGWYWCKPCNAKRFKENFKNWTSGNKDIDELIQHSQLNATYCANCLEWIPFENFQNVTYVTRGGFGKIYSADWPEGNILNWDIENQKWRKWTDAKVVLKSLDNSSNISADFLNEIKSYLQIYFWNIVLCFGMTQDPNTKDFMMILVNCKGGSLRNYLNQSENYICCHAKIHYLFQIAKGLRDIHIAGKVHKDLHPGNILFESSTISCIGDLGMCQSVNNEEQSAKKEIYGVLPYVAPEVLCGHEYTEASDIYSFGVIMNEFLSEEIPYNIVPHDHILAVKICKGLRPSMFEDIPKLFADLIMKCWDIKAENRPTAKELSQILKKLEDEKWIKDSEIYSQIMEYDKIKDKKLRSNSIGNKSNNLKTHPEAIYTSRLLKFKNLPDPVNSSDRSCQINSGTKVDVDLCVSENPISECLDCQLSELDINEV